VTAGGIGRRAFVQRVERILQDLADAGRAVGIDHVRVEIKIEPGQMLAEYRNGLQRRQCRLVSPLQDCLTPGHNAACAKRYAKLWSSV
jgi:hypothetical protein